MKKFFILFFIAWAFCFASYGQNNPPSGYWTDEGVREEVTPNGDVYSISTPGQLGWIAWKIITEDSDFKDYIIDLQSDIDLSGHYWIPIEIKENGVFRGNNHTISNISITYPSGKYNNNSYFGFFAEISSSSNTRGEELVANLTLENVEINPERLEISRYGGFAGYVQDGIIRNCHVKKETVHVSYNNVTEVGALVGSMQEATIDNCTAEEITLLIENLDTNQGFYSVSGGGVATVFSSGGNKISNCAVSGTLKNGTLDWGKFTMDELLVGEFVGVYKAWDPSSLAIENSYSTFDFDLTGIPVESKVSVGGLLGSMDKNNATIAFMNCFYNGAIVFDEQSSVKEQYVGNLAGNIVEGNTLMFENCFYPENNSLELIANNPGNISTDGCAPLSDETTGKLNEWVSGKSGYNTWIDGDENPVFENPNPVEGTDYTVEEDTYTLLTPKGLLWFADQVNNFGNKFEGKTVRLGENTWKMPDWVSIGKDESNYFGGAFDGNNQKVSITGNEGFFGYVQGGTVENLTVHGTLTEAGSTTGIVIGKALNETISNVTSQGSLVCTTGSYYVGGVVAFATNCVFADCVNEATIDSKLGYCGGIVGCSEDCQISNCSNTGGIKAGKEFCGGIAGTLDVKTNGKVITLSDCLNTGSIEGTQGVGGIVGAIEGYDDNVVSGQVTVINSINKGEVRATAGQSLTGGIVGFADASQFIFQNGAKVNTSIVNCANLAPVSGTQYVGGIVSAQAWKENTTGIELCIHKGTITGTTIPYASLIAYSATEGITTVRNSYYQQQTGVEVTVSDQEGGSLITENLFPIPEGDNTWVDQLNSFVSEYNAAHPDGPLAYYWTIGDDGNPTYGAPTPVIEGETPYKETTMVTIHVMPGAAVYYTTDGSEPTINSTLYTAPFSLSGNLASLTTTVKAISVMNGLTSGVIMKEFVYDPYYTVDISVTDPASGSVTVSGSAPGVGNKYLKGTVLTLTAVANSSYTFSGWSDGNTENPRQLTISQDIELIASFSYTPPIIPQPSYYNIYVEDVCDGVEVTLSNNVVCEGNSISVYVEKDTANYTFDNFHVYYKEGYYGPWKELPEGVQPGEYPIKNIWTHIYIKAEGAEKKEDPTGIESIEGVKVYTKDGSLYVQTPQREQVIIVSMSGAIVKNEEQVGLKQYHGLQPGIYIVRVGETTYKLRLN